MVTTYSTYTTLLKTNSNGVVSLIYVLKLEEDKYYVGYTTELNIRLAEHMSGRGSTWTKKYPVVKLVKVVTGSKDDERAWTLKVMEKYGWQNVRGAGWTSIDMHNPPKDLLN